MILISRVSFVAYALLLAPMAFAQTESPTPPPPANPPVEAPASVPVPVRGTRVSLIPPAGFTPAPEFTGFAQKENSASIMVTEIPGAYSKVTQGFSMPKELAKQGMTLVSRFPITLNGYNGMLVEIRQKVSGFDFRKWVVILGNAKESVLVTAAFPTDKSAILSQTLKNAVLTTDWKPIKPVSLTEGIRFSVAPSGGLRLAKRLQNNLIYTQDARFPSKSPDSPIFFAGPAASEMTVPAGAQETVAKQILSGQGRLSRTVFLSSAKETIGGFPGITVQARAVEAKTNAVVFVYQTVVYLPKGFYLLQGVVSAKNAARWLPAFENMTRSFRLLPNSTGKVL